MAPQALLENLYQDGPAVYKAISVLLVLATVLYIHSRSAVKDVSRFPLIGQNVGGFSKRRRYFVNHALELFLEGYLKVPFNVEHHMSILLIILSSKTLCGVSLQQMVGNMMTFPTCWSRTYMLVPYLHLTGEVLVLPLRYAEELRELPEDVVSSNAANEMVSLSSSFVCFPSSLNWPVWLADLRNKIARHHSG